jgi:hypothetical protein
MNKKMNIAALATITLLGAGLLTACGEDLTAGDPPASAPAASEPAAVKPAETPVAPAPVEEAKADEGTFGNPFAAGTPVGNEEVTITLGAPSDGTAAVKAANPYNDDPVNGAYVAVPVTVLNVKADKITPWLDVRIKIVSPDGRSWDSSIVTIDGALDDAGDLYPGGTATAPVYFDMPLDATAGAMAAVTYSFSKEVLVKLT